MNVLFPLAGAFFQAGSAVLDKVVLQIRGVRYPAVLGATFAFSFFVVFVVFLIYQPPFPLTLFGGWMAVALAVNILIGIGTNLFYYRALAADQLNEVQTIDLLHRFPVIVLCGLLFADERNPIILVTALISAGAILWSHWDGRHIRMNHTTAVYLFWIVCVSPFAVIMSKILLAAWNPISYQLVRNATIALLLAPFVLRDERRLPPRSTLFILLSSMLTSIAWILLFRSYQLFGVIFTYQLFALEPFLVYLSSLVFLREAFHAKKFFAFIIVLLSIVATEVVTR